VPAKVPKKTRLSVVVMRRSCWRKLWRVTRAAVEVVAIGAETSCEMVSIIVGSVISVSIHGSPVLDGQDTSL